MILEQQLRKFSIAVPAEATIIASPNEVILNDMSDDLEADTFDDYSNEMSASSPVRVHKQKSTTASSLSRDTSQNSRL